MENQERGPSPPPPPAAWISGSRLAAGDPSVAASFNHPSADPPLDSAEALVRLQESAKPAPVSPPVAEGAAGVSGAAFVSDDLRDKIVRQVEYYFSDENLPNDKFLLKQLRRDKEGYEAALRVSTFLSGGNGELAVKFKPSSFQGKPEILLSDSEVEELARPHALTLVGNFPAGRPKFAALKSFFQDLQLSGRHFLSHLNFRYILIRFQNAEDYAWVFAKGTYFVQGFPIKFFKWSIDFDANADPPIVPVVSSDGKKVKRLHPLPVTEDKDAKPRTVLVENLPEDHSEDNIRRMFEPAGHIIEVTIRDPHSAEQSAILSEGVLAISSKLHALVEYNTVEAAENAVLALNDEKNWRSGMQVQLLLKRMEKYGLVQKERKDVSLENNHGAEALEMPEPDQGKLIKKEDEEHINGVKGGRRSRYKSRGRGYHHQPINGQGHGHVPSISTVEGLNKLIPGPKMPDGTRGFTMGRGKPITS